MAVWECDVPEKGATAPDQMVFTTDGTKLLSFYPDAIRVSVVSADELQKRGRRALGENSKSPTAEWKSSMTYLLKTSDTLIGARRTAQQTFEGFRN